jgi:hypothetical protein
MFFLSDKKIGHKDVRFAGAKFIFILMGKFSALITQVPSVVNVYLTN